MVCQANANFFFAELNAHFYPQIMQITQSVQMDIVILVVSLYFLDVL